MKRFGFIGFGAMARHVLKVLEGYNGAVPELIGILETLDAVGDSGRSWPIGYRWSRPWSSYWLCDQTSSSSVQYPPWCARTQRMS